MSNEEALALKLNVISTKMQREMKKHLFWGKFIGLGSPDEKTNDPASNKFAGKPFLIIDEIKKARMGNMAEIPLTLELAGPPTYGSAAVVGREEPMARKWAEVYVNTVRHAVQVEEGSMETFNERALNAAADAVPLEAHWHGNMENWQILTGIYEGLSENLTTSATHEEYGQGRGFAKRYHPNLFRWNGASQAAGSLSKVGTVGKFATAAEIFNAAGGANPLAMSSYTVEAARVRCMKSGLRPIVLDNGYKFFPWVISIEQAMSLRSDSRFQATMNSPQWKDIKDHPDVRGAIGYYLGFLFFEDTYGIAVRGYSGADANDLNIVGSVAHLYDENEKQNPRFLPQTGMIVSGSLSNQCGIIFGESFMGKALGSDPMFRYREEDYGDWKGLACRAIYGWGRLDYVPPLQIPNLLTNPASITGVYNRSSMLVMTHEKVL